MPYLHLPRHWARGAWLLVAMLGLALTAFRLPDALAEEESGNDLVRLPPISAIGLRLDTLLVGGYAAGSFTEAMDVLAGELHPEERALAGSHLEKVFGDEIGPEGLGVTGRLRVAFERAVRSDGTTRGVRVLAAEMAVGGTLKTAYYFEHDGKPGFYDPFGRELGSSAWTKPVDRSRISSPFGLRRMHPILRRVLPHTGVDYAAASGTPVHATADGVVSVAGRRGGYGTMVEVRHPNGYSTRYAHLSSLSARAIVGSVVEQGDVIGRVGMTGLATGPHLHYEVRRRGQPIDPTSITAAPGFNGVGGDAAWPAERGALSALLATAPATLRSR